jgi:hypothetical protein
LLTGTEGLTVGTGVTGGKVTVAVAVGVGLGFSVGVAVRGAGVAESDGLGEVDGDGDGLADGAATCCEEITAAPRRRSATRATAAKTVNTVDQRSACRRTGPPPEGDGATFASAGGRSSWAVASGSTGVGFSCTVLPRRHDPCRTVGRSFARRCAGTAGV